MKEQRAEAIEIAPGRGRRALKIPGARYAGVPAIDAGRVRVVELEAGAEVAKNNAPRRFLEDVLCLHVAVHEPRAMHGIQCTTQFDSDRNLGRIEGSTLGEFGLERPSLNELHPEARASLNTLRTVNGCDVRMADTRHQSTLVDDLRVGQTPAVRVSTQQLERHFQVQARCAAR